MNAVSLPISYRHSFDSNPCDKLDSHELVTYTT